MLDLQPLGQKADAGLLVGFRQSPERQQELMLLRLESGRSRRLLAEMQEPSNLIAKLCQKLII